MNAAGAGPAAPRPAFTPARLLLGGVVAAVALICSIRAGRLDYDYHHFKRDADYVWQHGELNPVLDPAAPGARQLPFYLPIVPLALAPLSGLGPAAPIVWGVGQALCLTLILRRLASWLSAKREGHLAAATLLALPAIYEAARFNQLSFLTLALLLAGEAALSRGHPIRAGGWLAVAAILKLLPAVFVGWLLVRRQWRGLAAFFAVAVGLCAAPCAIFGVEKTELYYAEWWNFNVRGALLRGDADVGLREHFLDHRNQSIAAVVGRLCQAQHPYAAPHPLASWDAATCAWVSRGLAALLLLLVVAAPVSRGAGRRAARWGFARFCLAMVALSPLLRQYYLVWAVPVLLLAIADIRRRSVRGLLLALIWLAGMVAWLSPTARTYGAHLVMLVMLLVLSAWGGTRKRRATPAAAEPPAPILG